MRNISIIPISRHISCERLDSERNIYVLRRKKIEAICEIGMKCWQKEYEFSSHAVKVWCICPLLRKFASIFAMTEVESIDRFESISREIDFFLVWLVRSAILFIAMRNSLFRFSLRKSAVKYRETKAWGARKIQTNFRGLKSKVKCQCTCKKGPPSNAWWFLHWAPQVILINLKCLFEVETN